jgi:condensin-2 complex subunit G2
MILLEAPHTHAVLRALLPFMGNLIHDKVERVRLAAVKMLLCVKHVKDIKFYHVVPVDHLLARLAAEGETRPGASSLHPSASSSGAGAGPVASALTALLLNSYFPQGDNVTGSMQVSRTLGFLASDPAAAAVFYSHLSSHLSVNSVSKLIHMIHKCLASAIQTQHEREKKGSSSDKKEASPGEDKTTETALIASNTSLMASMAETMYTLWASVSHWYYTVLVFNFLK